MQDLISEQCLLDRSIEKRQMAKHVSFRSLSRVIQIGTYFNTETLAFMR